MDGGLVRQCDTDDSEKHVERDSCRQQGGEIRDAEKLHGGGLEEPLKVRTPTPPGLRQHPSTLHFNDFHVPFQRIWMWDAVETWCVGA